MSDWEVLVWREQVHEMWDARVVREQNEGKFELFPKLHDAPSGTEMLDCCCIPPVEETSAPFDGSPLVGFPISTTGTGTGADVGMPEKEGPL